MYLRCFSKSRHCKNTFLHAGICLVWIAGLTLGFAAERLYGDAYRACFVLAPVEAPDWIGLLSVNVLPLLISACAVLITPYVSYPLCFLRSAGLGLSLGAVSSVFGSAAVMMSMLLLFSVLLFSPVFLWFYCWAMNNKGVDLLPVTFWCVCIGLALASVDYWMVSPFLREVMIF